MTSKNSTTVRVTRLALRTGLRVAPGLFGAAMWWRFSLAPTKRMKVRPEQADVMARGERWSFRVDGQVLPAWRWGEGPTVLLVHGWGGRAAQLAAFVDPLIEAGFSVVAFDGPASGEATGKHNSMVHLGHAVAAMGRSLGPLHAVVAHSMGAGSTAYALRLGLDVERLVFVAPATSARRYVSLATAPLGLERPDQERLLEVVARHAGTSFERLDAGSTLRLRPHPVLAFHDADDREVPLDATQALADDLEGFQVVATEGLGHNRILGAPEVVKSAVQFVAAPAARAEVDPLLAAELAYGRA